MTTYRVRIPRMVAGSSAGMRSRSTYTTRAACLGSSRLCPTPTPKNAGFCRINAGAIFRFVAMACEIMDAESGALPAVDAETEADPSATARALACATTVRTPPIASGTIGEAVGSTKTTTAPLPG